MSFNIEICQETHEEISWSGEFSHKGVFDLLKTLHRKNDGWRPLKFVKEVFESNTSVRVLGHPANFMTDLFFDGLITHEVIEACQLVSDKTVYIRLGSVRLSKVESFFKPVTEALERGGFEKERYDIYESAILKTVKRKTGKANKSEFLAAIREGIGLSTKHFTSNMVIGSAELYGGLVVSKKEVTVPDHFIENLDWGRKPVSKPEGVKDVAPKSKPETVKVTPPVRKPEPPKPELKPEPVKPVEEVVRPTLSLRGINNPHADYVHVPKEKSDEPRVPTKRELIEEEGMKLLDEVELYNYNEFWNFSALLSQLFNGTKCHVDHATSVDSGGVSSIHPRNLQILTAKDNLKKNYRSWPRFSLEEQKDYIRKEILSNRGSLLPHEEKKLEWILCGLDDIF